MNQLTFDKLPEAVAELKKDLREIKDLLNRPEPQPTPEQDQLLTIQEVAGLLNLAVPTIYGKVCRQELPFMKKGKRLYFSKFEILEWLKSGRKSTIHEIEQEAERFLSNKKRVAK